MNARELRVWHWRKVVMARAKERYHEQAAELWECAHPGRRASFDRNRATAAHGIANWHLSAVQVLNDHPDCAGTTAEQDAPRMPDRVAV